MVDRTKKIGYYREAAFEKKKKCKKHFSSERLDLINCHFKCVGECAYSRGAMRGFGSCTYCPDGVCEIKKDWEGRWRNRETLVSAPSLGSKKKTKNWNDASGGWWGAPVMLMTPFVSHLLVKVRAVLARSGNPPPRPSPLCWICDLHCGGDDRESSGDNPLASVLPLTSSCSPSPSASTTKAVFCHGETAAVSQSQSIGFRSTLWSGSTFHSVLRVEVICSGVVRDTQTRAQ